MTVNNLLEGWSNKKIHKKKSFDELFELEEIPIWWFLKRTIVPHVLPKQLGTFDFYKEKKRLSIKEKIYYKSNSLIFPKYIYYKERKMISKLKNKKIEIVSKKDKVLFLTFTNHINTDGSYFRINKVLNKIKTDKRLEPFVLCCNPLSSKNIKNKLNKDNNLLSYYNKSLSKKAKIKSNELCQLWKEIPEQTKYEMIRSVDISYWPFLKYAFNSFLSKEFLYILVLYFEIFKKILIEEKIKVCVLTSQNSLHEKCLLAAAKVVAVPSVLIQHGTLEEPKVNPDLIYKTKLAVFSNSRKEGLIKLGVEENDIIVTGAVIFDEIYVFLNRSKSKSENLNLLIVTSPTIESKELKENKYWLIIENTLAEINQISNFKIDIKLHPREKGIERYKKIIKKNNWRNINIIQDNSRDKFYSLLSKCDVFIHFNSTAVLEAMILDKPIITIEITKGFKESITKKENCAIEANENSNFNELIKESIETKEEFRIKRRKFVEKLAGKVDGKAHIRVTKLIYELSDDKTFK